MSMSDLRSVEEQLAKKWACRRGQIKQLFAHLSPNTAISPPLYVSGPSGTGKTGIVCDVLRALGRPFCRVTRAEGIGQTAHLWTHIVSALRASAEKPGVSARVEDLGDALPHLRKLCSEAKTRPCIVLDAVQPGLPPDVVTAMIRLPQLLRKPIDVLIISTVPQSHSHVGATFPEPLPDMCTVHFPAYTTAELLSILAAAKPPATPAALYDTFLRRVIAPATKVSRKLSDLQLLAHTLQPGLCRLSEPDAGDNPSVAKMEDATRAVMRVFCQDFPGIGLDVRCALAPSAPSDVRRILAASHRPPVMELPYLSKFLLVAMHIASCNRPSSDVRVFTSSSSRGKRAKLNAQSREQRGDAAIEESTKAGQVVPLERWLQIFWKLLELEDSDYMDTGKPSASRRLHHSMQSADILHQIRHLVTIRLVNQVAGDCLDGCAYTANFSADMAATLAANLRVELKRFLVYI